MRPRSAERRLGPHGETFSGTPLGAPGANPGRERPGQDAVENVGVIGATGGKASFDDAEKLVRDLEKTGASQAEIDQVDTLNVYDESSQMDKVGTLTSTGLTGLGMAADLEFVGATAFGEPRVQASIAQEVEVGGERWPIGRRCGLRWEEQVGWECRRGRGRGRRNRCCRWNRCRRGRRCWGRCGLGGWRWRRRRRPEPGISPGRSGI